MPVKTKIEELINLIDENLGYKGITDIPDRVRRAIQKFQAVEWKQQKSAFAELCCEEAGLPEEILATFSMIFLELSLLACQDESVWNKVSENFNLAFAS